MTFGLVHVSEHASPSTTWPDWRKTLTLSGEYQHPDLREALQLICHEKITARRLGGWLRSNRDRIVDALRAVQAGTDGHSKTALWAVRTDCG